ncbi:MAG: hypothetical protein ABMA13_20625 [Chthoniobacteraceae bacterium]
MPDADASASFDLDDDSLSAGLDSIAEKFGVIAAQINAQFAGANAQLASTATSAASVGAQAPLVARLGSGLALAAQAARTFTTGLSGIVVAAARIAPWVKYIPDSLGKWVPAIKPAASAFNHVAAQIGTVVKSAQALSGRLTVLNAGFMALNLREIGASRSMAVLGAAGALATSKIVAGARAAVGAVGALGMAAGRATRSALGGIGGAMGGIGRSLGTASMFLAPMAGMALMLGPVGVAAASTAGAFAGLGKSISAAAQMQTFSTTMSTLLGSTAAAQKRMAELNTFAAETPFDLPGVVQASKVLQSLTAGALATGEGLRLVGDIASASGQPFEDIAVHVGRMYDGLMNGRPVGEAMQRLQQLGIVTSATRSKLEALQQSGGKGAAVWTVAARDLTRFSGEMARQSGTWGGIMSNFSDGVGRVFQAIGAPLITALTPFMQRMNAWLGTLIPWAEKFGSIVAGWAALIAQVFADGKMGEVLGLSLKIGFAAAVNFLLKSLVGTGDALIALLSSASAWKGVGNALSAVFDGVIAALMEGAARVLDKLSDVPWIGGKATAGAAGLRAGAEALGQRASETGGRAMDQLSAALGESRAAFIEGFGSIGDVMDSSADKSKLLGILGTEWAAAQKGMADTAKAAEKGGLPAAAVASALDEDGKKKGKEDVASLQRIAGGGGIVSGRDPLLGIANKQLDAAGQTNRKLDAIHTALTSRRIGGGVPVFG